MSRNRRPAGRHLVVTSAPVPEEFVTLASVHVRAPSQLQGEERLRKTARRLQAQGIYAVVYTVHPYGVDCAGWLGHPLAQSRHDHPTEAA